MLIVIWLAKISYFHISTTSLLRKIGWSARNIEKPLSAFNRLVNSNFYTEAEKVLWRSSAEIMGLGRSSGRRDRLSVFSFRHFKKVNLETWLVNGGCFIVTGSKIILLALETWEFGRSSRAVNAKVDIFWNLKKVEGLCARMCYSWAGMAERLLRFEIKYRYIELGQFFVL